MRVYFCGILVRYEHPYGGLPQYYLRDGDNTVNMKDIFEGFTGKEIIVEVNDGLSKLPNTNEENNHKPKY